MSDAINPYRSPAPVAQEVEPTTSVNTAALRRLRIPSIGLLVISGIMGTFGLVHFPFILTMLILEIYGVHRWGPWNTGEISFVDKIAILIIHMSNYCIVLGAWRMLLGKNYRLCYTAAILASIPFLSTMTICAIPFGIWALVLLHRKDVNDAFAAKAAEKTSTPKSAIP
jgi:hypothetical protein